LQIFFPRSIEGEIAAREEAKELRRSRRTGTQVETDTHSLQQPDTYLLTSSPVPKTQRELHDSRQYQRDEERDVPDILPITKIQVHRHTRADISRRTSRSVNPLISNFTSPIGRFNVFLLDQRRQLTD